MINVADQALNLLKKSSDPYSDIKRSSCYWIPLQWLYCELVKNKDLVPLIELDEKKQAEGWGQVKDLEKHRAVKIMVWQALYTWDFAKEI